jgi:two-component system sensor histidine kinase YesM
MDEERLKKVRKSLTDRGPEETEIYGLYNVNERIQLDFGREYGITIQSEHNKGTQVYVNLPFCPKEDEEKSENISKS